MRGAATLILLVASSPGQRAASRLVLQGPEGARMFLPEGICPLEGARLVLAGGQEPELPRDLLARSPAYRLEPREALAGLELEVAVPSSSSGAELYTSAGASSRPLVWHEVRGATSLASDGATLFDSIGGRTFKARAR